MLIDVIMKTTYNDISKSAIDNKYCRFAKGGLRVRGTKYLSEFDKNSYFSRKELFDQMNIEAERMTEACFKARLQVLLDEGVIARVGRNAYCVCTQGCRSYSYEYSQQSKEIARLISSNYPDVEFNIFELVQLNEFLNHQIAHNVYFVYVEREFGDFVFDILRTAYPGKVLICPDEEIYHQYWTEGMIVVLKLPTEAPKGKESRWATCIEKMIVDVFCEKVIASSYSSEEMGRLFENIFNQYAVDESKLFRYARRRGAEKKLRAFLHEKANVKLRLESRDNDNKI